MIDMSVDGVRGDGKPLILQNISWDEVVKIAALHPRWKITISPEPPIDRVDLDWDEELQ